MPRYRDRNTGSVINVSEATAVGLAAHFEPMDDKKADTKKADTTKKADGDK
jgi:hypothetical protein